MRILGLVVACLLVACSGSTPPEIDANPAGPLCSGQLYDSCFEEHDCMSNLCQNFQTAGIQVCSQACSDTNPCPDSTQGAVVCDTDVGACRPAVVNHCHL